MIVGVKSDTKWIYSNLYFVDNINEIINSFSYTKDGQPTNSLTPFIEDDGKLRLNIYIADDDYSNIVEIPISKYLSLLFSLSLSVGLEEMALFGGRYDIRKVFDVNYLNCRNLNGSIIPTLTELLAGPKDSDRFFSTASVLDIKINEN